MRSVFLLFWHWQPPLICCTNARQQAPVLTANAAVLDFIFAWDRFKKVSISRCRQWFLILYPCWRGRLWLIVGGVNKLRLILSFIWSCDVPVGLIQPPPIAWFTCNHHSQAKCCTSSCVCVCASMYACVRTCVCVYVHERARRGVFSVINPSCHISVGSSNCVTFERSNYRANGKGQNKQTKLCSPVMYVAFCFNHISPLTAATHYAFCVSLPWKWGHGSIWYDRDTHD